MALKWVCEECGYSQEANRPYSRPPRPWVTNDHGDFCDQECAEVFIEHLREFEEHRASAEEVNQVDRFLDRIGAGDA